MLLGRGGKQPTWRTVTDGSSVLRVLESRDCCLSKQIFACSRGIQHTLSLMVGREREEIVKRYPVIVF